MSSWKTQCGQSEPSTIRGFNGATTMSSWKTERLYRSQRPMRRFNGATTMSSWKTFQEHKVDFRYAASMEPRRCRRGKPQLHRHGG